MLACFLQQAWWVRGLEGAALGFATFVTIPYVYEWAKRQTETVSLTIGCHPAPIPQKFPASGRLAVMTLFPQGGGTTIASGEPDSPTHWSRDTAYQCHVRNLSGVVQPPLIITLPVEYRSGDGSPVDEAARYGKVSIVAERLSPSSEEPFVFYVTCPKEYGASVRAIQVDYFDNPVSKPPLIIKSNLVFPMEFGMAKKDS